MPPANPQEIPSPRARAANDVDALVVPGVRAEDVLRSQDAVFIDLRSPKEFAEDHLPGALNVPLFDDLERALIGTLYHRRSKEAAFDEGLRRTRQRIVSLSEEIARLADWKPERSGASAFVDELTRSGMEGMEGALRLHVGPPPAGAVVLNCWRGGMRSRSVTALMRALGLERAVVLDGGYKAYRRVVRDQLDRWQAPPSYVLRGLTGVGKTLVLRALERQREGWTIDLEGAAGHRSSILGMVGLDPVPQKTFETRLWTRLSQGCPGDLVVFEGESRKVGDVTVPDTLWTAMRSGTPLELVAPVERRVEILIADYLATEANRAPLLRQLPFIEERLGATKWRGVLIGLLEAGRDAELVEVLLERYYDPLYAHSERRFLAERSRAGLSTYVAKFDTSEPEEAAQAIGTWIEHNHKGSHA